MEYLSWYLIGAIFLVGMAAVIALPNLIKKVVGLSIANSALIMFFIYYGSLSGDTAPILTGAEGVPVDPLPQALMLTAIVIGVCIVALALALVYRLYQRFGTLDIREIERRVWGDRA
jgi:multicomponent Na+:H+ antiporter subunit C